MEQSSSFVQYQPFQLHLLHHEFQLVSCSTMAKRKQDQKEEERVVCKSRPSSGESIFFYCDKFLHRIESDCISKSGVRIASGKPDSRMSIEPSSIDAASTSQVRLKDAHLGGLTEKQRRNFRIKKKKKIQKTPTILRLRPGTTKENLLPKTAKLGGNPLHTEPVHQLTRKVKRTQKRRGTTISTYRRTHPIIWMPSSPWSEKSTEDTWRSYERFECEFGWLESVHEYHS